jgi:RNA polymerase sigma-70 factor, ECF subfamily
VLPVVASDRTPNAGFDLERAYADHARILYGFVVNAVDDRAEAEDLVQEVFARAWRASSRYDPDRASVRTWLFTIARNLVLDAQEGGSGG